MKFLIMHGPNLNRLGVRKPEKYGHATLDDITADVDATAMELSVETEHFQSNHEGDLVSWLHQHQDSADAVIINPAGLTPYGYSLLDALRETGLPVVIVHLSQFLAIDGKERTDIFADSATSYIAGAGWHGYGLAVRAIHGKLCTS